MSSPAYAILFSAQVSASATSGGAGDPLIKDATSGLYVLATAAARGTRRTTGIALAAYTPNSAVEIQQFGQVSPTIAGLGAGSASWVRVSTAGALERCTPSGSDDVVGWVDADGTLHLCCGVLTASMAAGTTSGSVVVPALDVDWSAGDVFTKTLSAGSNTITFSNASDGQTKIVILTGAASTVTWPTVQWSGGIVPTQTPSGTDVYTFVKIGGSIIYGTVVQDMS